MASSCKIINQHANRWEGLSPTSFRTILYLHCLKISVTVGSFVMYTVTGETAPQIGRVVDVVSTRDLVPQEDEDKLHLIEGHPQGTTSSSSADAKMPAQFVKVNLFKCIASFKCRFPVEGCDNALPSTSDDGWQVIVQVDEHCWISSLAICDLSFVFKDEDVSSGVFDDCRGMHNFFVLKHRITQGGTVSAIPQHACPPFPGCIEGFHEYWCIDQCKLIYNNIRQIRVDMQRILCRVAQSQGDFSARTIKLQLPSCCWFYIKNAMARRGIESMLRVKNSQPRTILSWGLSYQSHRHTGHLDVLRFDTQAKLVAFRDVFGHTSGFGVRKKRPKYSDGRSLLCINDVINVVSCDSDETQQPQETDAGGSSSKSWQPFRNGVMQDGIDLAYDVEDGVLQVVVRYHKVVVNLDQQGGTLACLKSIGVALTLGGGGDTLPCTTVASTASILPPGMEFLDKSFVMRVVSVTASDIRARKVYKVLLDLTTVRSTDTNVVIYTDVSYVLHQIQEMLE